MPAVKAVAPPRIAENAGEADLGHSSAASFWGSLRFKQKANEGTCYGQAGDDENEDEKEP
jgi:hypothetical protein